MAVGETAWAMPQIMSLNAWLHKTWKMAWPEYRPLNHLSRLVIWQEAVNLSPPPPPIDWEGDMSLLESLDESYAVLVRHEIAPEGRGEPYTTLSTWRQKVCQNFERLASIQRAFHPAHLPDCVKKIIQRDEIPIPKQIVLAAFEAPSPIEEKLFDVLAHKASVCRLDLPTGKPCRIRAVILPDRDQEVKWLVEQVTLDAQHIPLNGIGVIVPDLELYLPYLRNTLNEVIGPSLVDNYSAFNISLGEPLSHQSLVLAGLLPLRLATEGEPRQVLLSLLLSPYYGRWAEVRDQIARADRIWRENSVDANIDHLLRVAASRDPNLFYLIEGAPERLSNVYAPLRTRSARRVPDWINILERFWNELGFPVIADQIDTSSWKYLKDILLIFKKDLRKISLTLYQFHEWLKYALARETIHTQGSEHAGIQIVGLIESRGLSFEKVYVLGLAGTTLPRPVRPLPLLDPEERGKVQGGTPESQFSFAKDAFQHLLACAPDVTLIRPEQEGGEPLSPSPFWPDSQESRTVDLWNEPNGVWSRIVWLSSAYEGMKQGEHVAPCDPPLESSYLPRTISVSELAIALACPFRFLMEKIINIQPLEQVEYGVHPKVFGSYIHRLLGLFGRSLCEQGLDESVDQEGLQEFLKVCVDQMIRNVAQNPQWSVELRRWLGERDKTPGLLDQWLRIEIERLRKGWKWLKVESSFSGLSFPDWPFSVSGRIDRIDYHPDKGIVVWDYKTGEIPSKKSVTTDLIEPQIPLYILALKEHKVAGITQNRLEDRTFSGGYISLKKWSSISHQDYTPEKETWEVVLKRWQEVVSDLGKLVAAGQYPAEPYPVSRTDKKEKPCEYCPYRPLCNPLLRT